uniref:cyclic pyranopterin monophosphate synthase n=1 Tax=Arcella intermedia TaxID=1963864 RepID=A0A6B2LMY4_9EUKA
MSHVNEKNQPQMVDVSGKEVTSRTAVARSTVRLPPAVVELLKDGEIQSKKGPVFATAIIAGTMAAKRTSDLIPFCHPLAIEHCDIHINLQNSNEVVVDATVRCHNKTGVEMEALVAASTASLTIYDMCKAVSHDIVIAETRLMQKTGGKSGTYTKSPLQ